MTAKEAPQAGEEALDETTTTESVEAAPATEVQPGEADQALAAESTDSAESQQGADSGGESEELETLRQELKNSQEQVLRAHAEMQNARKRSEAEVQKARKFALEKFVRELLPVVDSLEKAIESMQSDDEGGEQLAAYRDGVSMTLGMMLSTLQKFDVEIVDPQGETFNPESHEAMSMVPNDSVPPNTVVGVLQKGYRLNGRLVRPAMVMVSRAP